MTPRELMESFGLTISSLRRFTTGVVIVDGPAKVSVNKPNLYYLRGRVITGWSRKGFRHYQAWVWYQNPDQETIDFISRLAEGDHILLFGAETYRAEAPSNASGKSNQWFPRFDIEAIGIPELVDPAELSGQPQEQASPQDSEDDPFSDVQFPPDYQQNVQAPPKSQVKPQTSVERPDVQQAPQRQTQAPQRQTQVPRTTTPYGAGQTAGRQATPAQPRQPSAPTRPVATRSQQPVQTQQPIDLDSPNYDPFAEG